MINIRKLAAVDMAWLGKRVILAEYALGIVLPLALGILSVQAGWVSSARWGWATILGLWLIGIAANYIPLLVYAVLIARAGTVKAEGQAELAVAKRYGVQQVVILVPLLVVAVALTQESRRRRKVQS